MYFKREEVDRKCLLSVVASLTGIFVLDLTGMYRNACAYIPVAN